MKVADGPTARRVYVEGFMQFLLSTLPEETRRNYLKKLTVSIEFWRTKGCLADETIQKLRMQECPLK